jgi:hypothetical protein
VSLVRRKGIEKLNANFRHFGRILAMINDPEIHGESRDRSCEEFASTATYYGKLIISKHKKKPPIKLNEKEEEFM